MGLLIKKKLDRICPICSHGFGEILHNQRFVLPEKQQFLPESYDIVACLKCGFVYDDTTASQGDYDRFYQEFSKYEGDDNASGGGSTQWDAKRLERTACDIAAFLPNKDIEILDIGCAKGGLLALLENKEYHRLTGLDLSPLCILYIQKNYGIQTIAGGLFTLDINSIENGSLREKFDLVILSHVVEHVRDLQLMMKNVFHLVKMGGLLYIEVPDASSYSDYFISPYHYFDREHINHFDEHSLQNLTKQNGFERVFLSKKEIPISESNVYPAIYVFYKKVGINKKTPTIIPDYKVRNNTIKYIEKSHQADRWPELDELVISQEDVIVWGVGSFTMRLLENTPLGKCNIVAFIDNDLKKQGSKVKNAIVYSPAILKEHKGPVIVSSAIFNDEIVKEIKKMDINNKIIIIK